MKYIFVIPVIFFVFLLLVDSSFVRLYAGGKNTHVTYVLAIDEFLDFQKEYDIDFDESLISGLVNPIGKEDISWHDHVVLVDGEYRRKANVNDSIRIPPNTRVQVLIWIKNKGLVDNIFYNALFFPYRPDKSYGDWCNFAGQWSEDCFFRFFHDEDVLVSAEDSLFTQIYEIDILQPLEILDFSYGEFTINGQGDVVVDFHIQIINNSNILMEDVRYEHGDIELFLDLEPGVIHEYDYQVNYGSDYHLGTNVLESFRIFVPEHKECAVKGAIEIFESYVHDSKISVLFLQVGSGWTNFRIQDLPWYPEEEGMCIEMIPHVLEGYEVEYRMPLSISFETESEVSYGLGENLVLDIKVENLGDLVLNDIKIGFEYEADFQILNFSSCVLDEDDFVFSRINPGEVLYCNVHFLVDELESFLNLRYQLLFADQVVDEVSLLFYPDVEISLSYESGDFVFSSSYEVPSLVFSEFFAFRGVETCKRFSFLGLMTELCSL